MKPHTHHVKDRGASGFENCPMTKSPNPKECYRNGGGAGGGNVGTEMGGPGVEGITGTGGGTTGTEVPPELGAVPKILPGNWAETPP